MTVSKQQGQRRTRAEINASLPRLSPHPNSHEGAAVAVQRLILEVLLDIREDSEAAAFHALQNI
jgi:hypothetical protein